MNAVRLKQCGVWVINGEIKKEEDDDGDIYKIRGFSGNRDFGGGWNCNAGASGTGIQRQCASGKLL